MNGAVYVGVAVGLLTLGTVGAARRARRVGDAQLLRANLAQRRVRVRRATAALAMWSAPPAWFLRVVADLAPGADASAMWRWYRGVALAVIASGYWFAGPVLALLGAGLVGGVPHVAAATARGRRAAAYDATLAVGLDAIARVVRGGGSLPIAIGEAADSVRGQVADDLRLVATTVRRGGRLDTGLAQWRGTRDRASVRLAVGAIGLAATTGGPPARVIEDVAASLRGRLQVEGEARALGAQARLSALVVGVAPIGFALVSCAADPRNAQLMFGTPIGVACLSVGLTLDVIGAVWMHRISEAVLG